MRPPAHGYWPLYRYACATDPSGSTLSPQGLGVRGEGGRLPHDRPQGRRRCKHILDGEVAIYDQAHISRFEWLRARPKDGRATLPVYMVFDVLELDGKDWRPEPLWNRRRVLEALVARERQVLPVRRLSSNGLKAWAQAVHKGYEGIVGKDPESPYVGGRTLKWLKVKVPHYREGERGWEPKDRS